MTTKGESITVHLTEAGAIDAREAFAKELYSLLFTWLVDTVNRSTGPDPIHAGATSIIGLLDIFGYLCPSSPL